MTHWSLREHCWNISHRGGALLAPENTLEAIQLTQDLGVSAVEFDVYRSTDGVLFLFHDDILDRCTDGTGPVTGRDWATLQRLDAGFGFQRDGEPVYRGRGVRIPSLEAVLTTFPDLYWDVEIKQPGIYAEVISLLTRLGLQEQCFIAAFDDVQIQGVRRDFPGWVTNFGWKEIEGFASLTEAAEATYEPPGEILQVQASYIDAAFMARARRFGLQVHVWTVNDADEMKRLLAHGVDGIITDRPDLLKQLHPAG